MRRDGRTLNFRLALLSLSIFVLALAGCAAPSGDPAECPSGDRSAAVATEVAPTVAAVAPADVARPRNRRPRYRATFTGRHNGDHDGRDGHDQQERQARRHPDRRQGDDAVPLHQGHEEHQQLLRQVRDQLAALC